MDESDSPDEEVQIGESIVGPEAMEESGVHSRETLRETEVCYQRVAACSLPKRSCERDSGKECESKRLCPVYETQKFQAEENRCRAGSNDVTKTPIYGFDGATRLPPPEQVPEGHTSLGSISKNKVTGIVDNNVDLDMSWVLSSQQETKTFSVPADETDLKHQKEESNDLDIFTFEPLVQRDLKSEREDSNDIEFLSDEPLVPNENPVVIKSQREDFDDVEFITDETMPNTDDNSLINMLPQPLLVKIFAQLKMYDLLQRAGLVCKYWHDVAHDPELWRVVGLRGMLKISNEVLTKLTSLSNNVIEVDLTDAKVITNEGVVNMAKSCRQLKILKMVR